MWKAVRKSSYVGAAVIHILMVEVAWGNNFQQSGVGLLLPAEFDESSMPPLYRYDNYEECMENGRTYCVARSLLQPDPSSKLWLQIKNFSSDVRHFRHYLLDRGICIDQCLNSLSGSSKNQRDELLVAPFEMDFNFRFNKKYFPRLEKHQEFYADIVNECINLQLQSVAKLKAYSDIEYCQDAQNFFEPFDFLDVVCTAIICVLLGLTVLSTIFDYYLRNKLDKENYLSTQHEQIEHQFATIYSIPRNLVSLTVPPKSTLGQDFRFIEGIRFITMTAIIYLHTTVMLMNVPSELPELFEQTLYNPVLTTLSLFTPNLVQSFFTIGGILLAVNLQDALENDVTSRWKLLVNKLKTRLKRIFPLYLFVILLTASVFRHLKLGPLHGRIIGVESQNCRWNWWINVLFLNNYVKVEETCIQPSWYLSADFQFFTFGLLVLASMKWYPRSTKYWIVTMILINFLGPGLTMWISELPPLMATGTRPVLLLFTDDEWFARLYKPFHTSSAGYFYGVLAGVVYHRAKPAGQALLSRNVFQILKVSALLVVVVCYAPSYLIYETDWKFFWWGPVYGAISKNCWGFFCSVYFIEMALNGRNRLRILLEHDFLLPLGKLTYSVYHSHYLILMAFSSIIRAPVENNVLTPVLYTAIALVLSYGLGLVIFLLVEQPAANLLTSKNNYLERITRWAVQHSEKYVKKINKS
ncbi:nose resistant to fluoxetine protein 6-like [Wyeomyia smithii]|uniref:nose resistant to fluoxetine protein 6-like n=1 Tax=Wyeomyia smithii TaxID=174621 RepID=UPI002467F879|nr:nose resistant to fluoxetine protein 6-like [Wyeomyia smithii]